MAATRIIAMAIIIGAIILLPTLGGCIRENGDCPGGDSQLIYVRVADSSDNDISSQGRVTGADLFIFDQDGTFIQEISVTQQEISSHTAVKVKRGAKVVVWGNLDDNKQISSTNTLSSSKLTLLLDQYGYADTQSDLFHGAINLAFRATTDVVVSPIMARLIVTVRGTPTPIVPQDYMVDVELLNNGYTFLGDPTPGTTQMQSSLQLSTTTVDDLVMPVPINIIHAAPGSTSGAVINLLDANSDLIARVDRDNMNRPITPASGETANILIDMSGPILNILMEVTPWNEIFQWTEY